MVSYIKKIHKIVLYWSPIIGNYAKTFFFFVRSKFFIATTSGVFKNKRFRFRSCDISAIEETFIRGEYDFIVPVISQIASPLIVDVGMNIGDFAILAIATNPNSRIVGIEADRQTALLAEQNGRASKNDSWIVHHRAAWKNNDEVFLETAPSSVSNKVSERGAVPVLGIDLKTLWSSLPEDTVDVMKIDIEGAEEHFLFSQEEYMNKVDHLIVEIHPQACNESRIRKLLQQHFNEVDDITGRISSKPLLYCRRR